VFSPDTCVGGARRARRACGARRRWVRDSRGRTARSGFADWSGVGWWCPPDARGGDRGGAHDRWWTAVVGSLTCRW